MSLCFAFFNIMLWLSHMRTYIWLQWWHTAQQTHTAQQGLDFSIQSSSMSLMKSTEELELKNSGDKGRSYKQWKWGELACKFLQSDKQEVHRNYWPQTLMGKLIRTLYSSEGTLPFAPPHNVSSFPAKLLLWSVIAGSQSRGWNTGANISFLEPHGALKIRKVCPRVPPASRVCLQVDADEWKRQSDNGVNLKSPDSCRQARRRAGFCSFSRVSGTPSVSRALWERSGSGWWGRLLHLLFHQHMFHLSPLSGFCTQRAKTNQWVTQD